MRRISNGRTSVFKPPLLGNFIPPFTEMDDQAGDVKKWIACGVVGLVVILVGAGMFYRAQNTAVPPDATPKVEYSFSDQIGDQINESRHDDAMQISKHDVDDVGKPPKNLEPTAAMAISADQEVVERHVVDTEVKAVAGQARLLVDQLINTAAESILAGEIIFAVNLVRNAMNTNEFGSLQAGVAEVARHLDRMLAIETIIADSFEPQKGRDIEVGFVGFTERLLVRDISQNVITAEQNAERRAGQFHIRRSFSTAELSGAERTSRVVFDNPGDAHLLRGLVLWRLGDCRGAEMEWKNNTNDLSVALLAGMKGKADITPLGASAEVKPAAETQVLNELIRRNPGLTPECLSVDVLFGKIVRLEIVSLYIRDIGPVGMLEDIQSFVCMAFDPEHGTDRADSAPLNDLAPLRGLRLRELALSGTCVHDLTPLEGMPLEMLDVSNTNVRDITPLKKLPLKSLKITHTAIRNIAPIQNPPIERIWLDFNPAEQPRETDGKFRDVLRKMPCLRFINGRQTTEFNL